MDRIGEPYVRSSKRRRMNAGSETTGLGLGFFIAKTLLERSGATVDFENRAFPDRGAVIRVALGRAAISSGRSASPPLEVTERRVLKVAARMSLAMIDIHARGRARPSARC